jgi:biotin operon repressor
VIVSVLTEILLDMTRINRENLKVRILKLADLKSTGSPDNLAIILGISPRSVKRIVSEIREDGQEIRYCPLRGSYVTEKEYY